MKAAQAAAVQELEEQDKEAVRRATGGGGGARQKYPRVLQRVGPIKISSFNFRLVSLIQVVSWCHQPVKTSIVRPSMWIFFVFLFSVLFYWSYMLFFRYYLCVLRVASFQS